MKNKFGRLNGVTSLIMGIVSLLLGILLMVNPDFTLTGLCSIVGTVLLICGVVLLLLYFGRAEYKDHQSTEFTVTACMILAGIFFLVRKDDISSILPQFLAAYLVFSGVMKLQSSMDLVGMREGSWLFHFVVGTVILIAGGIVLVWPDAEWFTAKDQIPLYLCILMIADGILSIVTLIHVTMKRNRYRKLHPQEFVEVIEDKQE